MILRKINFGIIFCNICSYSLFVNIHLIILLNELRFNECCHSCFALNILKVNKCHFVKNVIFLGEKIEFLLNRVKNHLIYVKTFLTKMDIEGQDTHSNTLVVCVKNLIIQMQIQGDMMNLCFFKCKFWLFIRFSSLPFL